MSFAGKRVLSLESRRASETAELIRRNGGEPFVAPSMCEVPLETNDAAFAFAEQLLEGEFDLIILLTGGGTRHLVKILSTRYPLETITDALRSVVLAARGPKPVAALRELGLSAQIVAPEPNTWRELLTELEGRPERRVAVIEYGKTNAELVQVLQERGCQVTPVRIYQWTLPEDLQPLKEAIQGLSQRRFDVVLFTTSQQMVHLQQVAVSEGIDTVPLLAQTYVASIGPTCTETLIEYGVEPAMEPSHPKLGILVKEAAERCAVNHAHTQQA